MNARIESEPGPVKNRTTVERKSDREVVVTRTINGPARIVFEAFTKAELLKRWWVPKSMGMTLLSCEVDARVGGKYRLVFDYGGAEPAAFFGSYVEVQPHSRRIVRNSVSKCCCTSGCVPSSTYHGPRRQPPNVTTSERSGLPAASFTNQPECC